MIPLEAILNNIYGLKVDKAQDGKQELEMYIANMTKTCCDVRYRIILTDINMPRMDGIEAAA
jgi:CheY-like chemotaxis protein